MQENIKERISVLYEEHKYLIDSFFLPEDMKDNFMKVLRKKIKDNASWTYALSNLARYLNKCFKKSSIILIDEYDWPMENARGFYDNIHNFFKTMYSSIAKKNKYVHKILFIGTLPLGQSSFLFRLNNVVAYPMHEKPNHSGHTIFSDTFGFTEKGN
ncbi:6787_t:CDS:2 [Funneliformis mosseae]|uniref:6787_t:CDS:1 n=1 Tax=Funneliformis mosseae TaxID=27381 RepID=A0A9N9E0F3_FUNMO|nr:6787_t:CDS:2 [Funneliformis mosseae]